jgi:hypothetical protein
MYQFRSLHHVVWGLILNVSVPFATVYFVVFLHFRVLIPNSVLSQRSCKGKSPQVVSVRQSGCNHFWNIGIRLVINLSWRTFFRISRLSYLRGLNCEVTAALHGTLLPLQQMWHLNLCILTDGKNVHRNKGRHVSYVEHISVASLKISNKIKLKIKEWLFLVHAMKICGGEIEIWLHSFLISLIDGGGCSA